MYSILIKNGTVIDGTGKPGTICDVACEGNKIVNIDNNIPITAQTVVDAKGKVVAPGFIDIQNHADSYWQLFDNPGLNSLVTQGYTTILVGNCGASLAPLLSSSGLLALQKWHNLEGININWQTFAEFSEEVSRRNFGCNIASLVGYSTLRRGLLGDQVRSLDKAELQILMKNLRQSLEDGAFGLSSGLAYAHEAIISELELFELVGVVAKLGGLFSLHLRNEATEITESVEEALDIARNSEVNLKISHFKIRGESNFQYSEHILQMLEAEYHKGVNVHFDAYPYDTVWQVLFSYLPRWAIEGGRNVWMKYLQDSVQRKKILAYLASSGVNFKDLIITSTVAKLNMVGKKMSTIAKNLGISAEEALLEIIQKGGTEIMVFDKALSEKQVGEIVRHPLSIIATDGGGFFVPAQSATAPLHGQNKLVHPRCFGTTAKFLKTEIAAKRDLANAVWKLTGLPAKKIGLKGRGTLAVGAFADLVVFDPEKIQDRATLLNPYQFSEGIDYVIVNGELSVSNKVMTKNFSGRFLRKK